MSATVRIPYLQVFGPSGRDLVPGLGEALLSVTLSEQEGGESDECIITVSDKAPFNRLPPKGTKYNVTAGWQDGHDGTIGGLFSFETFRKSGDPEDGRTIELVCRAADFLDKMKQADSKHYDEESGFGTAGKIFEALAKEGGVSAIVDPEIAKIKIPYRLRWNQSAIDFASELADDLGVVAKPQMGQLVVRDRAAGKSASGKSLSPLIVDLDLVYDYDFDVDPRPQHKDVSIPWIDVSEGRAKQVIEAAKGQFARAALMHPAPSEEEAKAAAKAAGKAMNQAEGSGSISMAGTGRAMAGAPVTIKNGGADIEALDWEVGAVSHTIIPDDGWLAEPELQTAGSKEDA